MNRKKTHKTEETNHQESAVQDVSDEQKVEVKAEDNLKENAASEGSLNSAESSTAESVEEKSEAIVAKLENQVNEYKDKHLRLSAEFDNYRKRTSREKMDLIKYASEDVLKNLLPIIDDFERAIKAVEQSTDINAVKQGLSLIYTKFSEFLKANGVQEIASAGQVMDTDVHEAVTKTPVQDEAMKGKIVDVILKGYKLNDKVIRFSKVVIGE